MNPWTIEDSRQIYNIHYWSNGYFDMNNRGHLITHINREGKTTDVDFIDLVKNIKNAGLNLPVLVRFCDILKDRVDALKNAFSTAMAANEYQGSYTALYPIKVNQQRSVVETLINYRHTPVGLEAGSKPELMAVLALSSSVAGNRKPGATSTNGGIIVCNGYKDREYIRLALIGLQLGHEVLIVIEKPLELALVIEEARKMGIKPRLGIRARLASIGAGKWQNTGGEKGKFGLAAAQILEAVQTLKDADMMDCLKLLHVHLGSQIPNIMDIQKGMREAARYFAELYQLGIKLEYVDVGGGLGIDYEGTRSRSSCSTNYSIQEYANNVVLPLWEVCEQNDLPHPHIFTESGRAMTAHHAVLISNIINVESASTLQEPALPHADDPLIIHDLHDALKNLSQRSLIEAYHDASHWLSEAQYMYTHGILNLHQRALAEQYYFAICHKVRDGLKSNIRSHRQVLDELNDKLADKYFCNFSLFQSIPDAWAIEQVFPVLPLQRLQEAPLRRGVIEDLTCDSDGKIDHYVDQDGVEHTLPIHEIRPNEQYLIGIFLVGAYQEILGDLHNLFGDTDSVDVHVEPDGGYRLENPLHGDTVKEVLRYVNFDPDRLLIAFHQKLNKADLSDETRKSFLKEIESGLMGYTYFEE